MSGDGTATEPFGDALEDDPEHHTDVDGWRLRLYVAGESPKSVEAFRNLKALCEAHLDVRYEIEVVDLLEHPRLARGDEI
nr:circadian clock protein KaiB [Nocardioidaceae bacterium]